MSFPCQVSMSYVSCSQKWQSWHIFDNSFCLFAYLFLANNLHQHTGSCPQWCGMHTSSPMHCEFSPDQSYFCSYGTPNKQKKRSWNENCHVPQVQVLITHPPVLLQQMQAHTWMWLWCEISKWKRLRLQSQKTLSSLHAHDLAALFRLHNCDTF